MCVHYIYTFLTMLLRTVDFIFLFLWYKMDVSGFCTRRFNCMHNLLLLTLLFFIYIFCHLSSPDCSLKLPKSSSSRCVGAVPIRCRSLSRWKACPGQVYPKDPVHTATTSKHQPQATGAVETDATHSHTVNANKVHN